jgi:hypothetical protein
MTIISLVFSTIGIVARYFCSEIKHLHTAATVMVGIPSTMILGHHHPTPTVTTPITKITSRRTVTASTTPSATRRYR